MHITLLQKIILINIFTILLSFLLPIIGNQHIDFILIAATFLFGTIYSFEIFIVLGNFAELKKLMATECANLVYIYHTAKNIGKEFSQQIEERIEKYALTSIDYSLKYHVSSTDQDFLSIAEPIRTVEINEKKQESALTAINKSFHKIVDARYHLEQVAPREIEVSEWVMLILLGGVLIVILFLGREPDIASRVFSAIFAANVIGLLLLLDEADSNHIQETKLEYEIFNQVLRDIGKMPYYPRFAIKKGLIKPKEKPYRLGLFPKYPNLNERKIEVIDKEKGYVDILFLVLAVAFAVLISGVTVKINNTIPTTSFSAVPLPPSRENRSLQLNTFGITSPTPFTDPNAIPSVTPPAFPTSSNMLPTAPPTSSGSPKPTSTPTPTLPPTTNVDLTFYTAKFGPPSNPCARSHPPSGDDTGTYTDPITFASFFHGNYAPCTLIYVPRVRKYFINENTGAPTPDWVDLYLGNQSNSANGQICANNLTTAGHKGLIVVIPAPPPNLPYDPTPLFTPPNNCMSPYSGF